MPITPAKSGLTVSRKLSRVLVHQPLESFERYDLPERHVHGFSSGFQAEHFHGFVCQMGIKPYRCQRRAIGQPRMYNIAGMYVRFKKWRARVASPR